MIRYTEEVRIIIDRVVLYTGLPKEDVEKVLDCVDFFKYVEGGEITTRWGHRRGGPLSDSGEVTVPI